MIDRLKSILKRRKAQDNTDKLTYPTFPGVLEKIETTNETDVFIVGFPKSGNTLMQHILAHLYYGLNQETSRTMVNLIAPDIYNNSHFFRFNKTCFFKSHERPKPNYRRVIYLVRNGKDALLSYYRMKRNMGVHLTFSELLTGEIPIFGGSWQDHILAWNANPYKAEILWLKYEDICSNKTEVLKRICDFLNINRSEAELKRVGQFTSLEFMKEMEQKFDWQSINKSKQFKSGSKFIGDNSQDLDVVNDYEESYQIFLRDNALALKEFNYL